MTSTALQQALAEIQQPRSEYQLQHFVVNQHDTEPQRYRQCLIEIQAISYTLRTVKLELRKTALEIAQLRASGDEIKEIEAQIKEVGMEQTQLVMIGAERELEALTNIWLDFPKHYTHEQIEADQRDYWHERLIRQARLEAMGSGRVGWAQLDALRNIGELDTLTLTTETPMLTGE